MPKKKNKKPIPKPQCMIRQEGDWVAYKIEFDDDGQGLSWIPGRSRGPQESVENTRQHFINKGYEIVEWRTV